MIKVESETIVPLANDFPSQETGLPREAEDEEASTASWVNHCIESGFALDPNLDLDTLFSSIVSERSPVEPELMDDEPPPEPPVEPDLPPQPVTPLSPLSPASSDSGCNRTTNPVPRHKRPSHKRAELKRRDKIKNRLDDLKAQVPSIADKGKMSESTILSKAAEYAKHLKGDCERFKTEAGNLHQEIESLSTEIHTFQERLPAAGLKSESKEGERQNLDQLYKDYVAGHTEESWKFFLFSFFMNPMFESFKAETSTDCMKTFMDSVLDWTKESLSLSILRRQTLEKMRDISRETDILTHPESLPEQAMVSIGRTSSTVPKQHSNGSYKAAGLADRPLQPSSNFSYSVTNIHQSATPQQLLKNSRTNVAASLSAIVQKPSLHIENFSNISHRASSSSHQPVKSLLLPATAIPSALLQPVSSKASNVLSVTQLATSVGEASLSAGTYCTAVVASSPGLLSGHPVAHLITDNDCHEYDFDISVPLPDLPDITVSSPHSSGNTPYPSAIEVFAKLENERNSLPSQQSSSIQGLSQSIFLAQTNGAFYPTSSVAWS